MTLLALLVAWLLLTWGMTYIASQAEIAEGARKRLVALADPFADLLGCRTCISFWTGQAAAAALMGVAIGFGADLPWHAWIYLPPTAGVGAVGMVDLTARGGTNG